MTNKTEMEKVVEKLTKTYKALSKEEAEKMYWNFKFHSPGMIKYLIR